MENNPKRMLSLLVVGLFVLTGCTIENEPAVEEGFDSFGLQSMEQRWDDVENPSFYMVAPDEAPEQLIILKNELVDEEVHAAEEMRYDLESTSVTDEEIVIQYDGQEVRFERLSQTVAESENGTQYQYFGTQEEGE